ncbi:hypothetical protein [Ectobacillus panaciterrae]|uniref:hypothetical protein n=1 Tax=Ectobacillus panaciterrae TaxID=363872 RepID=UPI000411B73F|nr:hypothetical protein [Ectobacillus panaciterrae]
MSLKKKTEVRTGKMVRELMLADKDVTASLIMVYSNNGVNKEIKIEGLNPKSNEELFLSGNADWNQSVIYKIVDFSGKAEVGKAILIEMKKNNLTLEIERVMWSKDKQGDEESETEEDTLALVHTAVPKKEELPEPPVKKLIAEEPKPVKQVKAEEKPAPITPIHTERVQARPAAEIPKPAAKVQQTSQLQEQYGRLVAKAIGVCQDYELGMDVDDSIEELKEELQTQGVKISLDADIIGAVNQLRVLKTKGINLEKILNLV